MDASVKTSGPTSGRIWRKSDSKQHDVRNAHVRKSYENIFNLIQEVQKPGYAIAAAAV